MTLRPTEGARFLLERMDHTVRGATYRATIYTPEAEYAATASLADDDSVEVAPSGAPRELDDALATQIRLLARGAAKRTEEGLPTWPARLLRWRGPGRGS